MVSRETELESILAKLACCEGHEEETELGRSELASLLFHAQAPLLEDILKRAKRDNRLRRCLSAARFYSGISREKCEKIDAILQVPFPAAKRKRKRKFQTK
jgi:hypothetical protein